MSSQDAYTTGEKLISTLRAILREGNVRRVIIKDAKENIVADFPVTFAVVAALISAPLTLLAGGFALAKEYTITVIKRTPAKRKKPEITT